LLTKDVAKRIRITGQRPVCALIRSRVSEQENPCSQRIAVVNKSAGEMENERDMLYLRRCSGTEGLKSNRIKWWRLNGYPFFTVLVRTGSRSLWQSQAHFSLAQAKCLLFLHDQLMPDP